MRLLGISADVLRNVSVFIVLAFGISLLLPQVQGALERLFSKISSFIPNQTQTSQNQNSGFLAGLLIGVSLGLVWTPCVGPILASVITLAAISSVNFSTALITLSYSAGTSIPLLAITYGGRNLLLKNKWLVENASKIQKAFGILMILTALAILFNIDRKFQAYILEKFPQYGVGLTQFEDNPTIQKELEKLKPQDNPVQSLLNVTRKDAPELIEGGQWFNSEPLRISNLRGKVVLIDFWTYTCINCIRTLPYLRNWHEKYSDKGLVIIGVHTPEFEFEKNPDNVEKAILDFGLLYPIMQDNDYATWEAYNNRYWPAKYLINKDGKIVYTHFGEGAYDETEQKIQELLKETGAEVAIPIQNPSYGVYTKTPELYLGYERIEYLASPEGIKDDQNATYSVPSSLDKNRFAYKGIWMVGEQYASPAKNSSLLLNFEAREVFLVMRPKNVRQNGTIKVYLDDKIVIQNAGEDVVNGIVTVDSDRLYKVIKLQTPGNHILKLEFLDNDLELYAFTFG